MMHHAIGQGACALAFAVCAATAQAQPAAPSGEAVVVAEELVGRWLLISVIRDGQDVTRNGVTQAATAAHYDFRRDGTFTIATGDKVMETGTWTANATAVPKTFDHVPHLPNGRRPLVPGIYEVGGGVLKICLLRASPANTRPERCEARAANGSSMYLLTREPPASPGLSATDIAAIRATTDRWVTAVRGGNWVDAAAMFTEDAILRFGDAAHVGRPAILEFHQAMQPWTPERAMHIDEIRGHGDMAFVMGHSTVTPATGGVPVVVSRYLDIRLRQADGTWLFYRDVVSPVPPQAKRPPG